MNYSVRMHLINMPQLSSIIRGNIISLLRLKRRSKYQNRTEFTIQRNYRS